ncbi:MAG: Hsp33 family molecular chaperone HslO [Oscillospiraceae bacterium]
MSKITRAISDLGGVIIAVADSTDMVGKAEQIHKPSAVVTAALGRVLTGASLMGSVLKGYNDTLTIKIKGDGDIGTILATADSYGNVKGYAQNNIVEIDLREDGKLNVGKAVGKGILSVAKKVSGAEPFVGQVELVSGEIAEDITSYFAVSEQTPTVCGLGVLVEKDLSVKKAGGFLLQLLPGSTEEEISQVEKNLKNLKPITEMMANGLSSEDIINILMDGFNHNILDEFSFDYKCDCSEDRVINALMTLSKEELEDMKNDIKTEVTCQFCDAIYTFEENDINSIILKRG